jgi:hypothetical protein
MNRGGYLLLLGAHPSLVGKQTRNKEVNNAVTN